MATVSIYKSPGGVDPVSNDIWWILQTTDATLDNFKYIIDLTAYKPTPSGVTAIPFATQTTVPRPTNNLGYWSPSKLLNSAIDNGIGFWNGISVNPATVSSIIDGDLDAYTYYGLRYGYEWNPNLQFNSILNVSGYFGLTFGATHGLSVNDQIYISSANQYLGGTATVTGIVSSNSIRINKSFTSSVAISYGSVTDAIHYNASTFTNFIAWNGAIDYGQENIWSFSKDNLCISPTNSKPFLTKFTTGTFSGKLVGINNYETLTFLIPQTYGVTVDFVNYFITTYKNGALVATYSIDLTPLNIDPFTTCYNKFVIGSGPQNLSDALQPLQPMTDITDYKVQVFIKDGSGNKNGPIQWYKIDNKCTPFNTIRLVYLNRLGGYEFFNFKMNSKWNDLITRKQYKQVLQPFYTTGQRGTTNLSLDVTREWTINSDYLTESEFNALNDLLTSLEVYIINEKTVNYVTTFEYLPIVITDSNYEQKTYITDKVFNLTLNYRLAYEKIIQSN